MTKSISSVVLCNWKWYLNGNYGCKYCSINRLKIIHCQFYTYWLVSSSSQWELLLLLCILLFLCYCLLLQTTLCSVSLNGEVHFWLRKQCPGKASIEGLDEDVPCSWDPYLLSTEGKTGYKRCGQRDRIKQGCCIWRENYSQWQEEQCKNDGLLWQFAWNSRWTGRDRYHLCVTMEDRKKRDT